MRTWSGIATNTTTFRRQNPTLTTILPFLNTPKSNLTSAMQKNSKIIHDKFVNTKTTFPKNFRPGPRNRSWKDGSTTAWISSPEVIDKYVFFVCVLISDSVYSAPDLSKIMHVLLGLATESELSENDAVYLTALSLDVYFAQFLASLGSKTVRWSLAKNVPIPPLPSNRDVITFARIRFGCPVDGMLHARTVLRMLGAHTLGIMHPELITILSGVVVNWL